MFGYRQFHNVSALMTAHLFSRWLLKVWPAESECAVIKPLRSRRKTYNYGVFSIIVFTFRLLYGCKVLLSACLYVSVFVCLCVCVFAPVFRNHNLNLIFLYVTYDYHGSAFLWRQCNMLCTLCFVDDVMFSEDSYISSSLVSWRHKSYVRHCSLIKFARWRHRGDVCRLRL